MKNVKERSDTTLIEGKSKLVNRPRISKGKKYDSYFVYIPSEVARDSNFPFKHGDDVIVKIDPANRQIIIKKSEDLENEASKDSS